MNLIDFRWLVGCSAEQIENLLYVVLFDVFEERLSGLVGPTGSGYEEIEDNPWFDGQCAWEISVSFVRGKAVNADVLETFRSLTSAFIKADVRLVEAEIGEPTTEMSAALVAALTMIEEIELP